MLDPIQMGLLIIRLGCSRFAVEHWSLPIRSSSRNQCDPDFYVRACDRASMLLFVRLHETNVIQFFFSLLEPDRDRYYALCLRTNIDRLVIIEK